MRDWKTTSHALVARLLELEAAPIRLAHTPADGGIVGDPYARGFLESVDALIGNLRDFDAESPEALITTMIMACETQAQCMPSYVRRGPDGSWLPGSPYDQGKVDGALKIKSILNGLAAHMVAVSMADNPEP